MPLWKSIVQKFDWTGKPKDQVVEVEGTKALDVLEQVDTLLDESQKMLVSARPTLSNREINMFEDKHSELYLAVVAVRSEVREKKEQDDFFSSPEEKTEFYTEVQKLLRQCQTYHRDVLTASQRARLNKAKVQLNDVATSASSTEQTSGSSPNLSWMAVALSAGSSASADGETVRHFVETPLEFDTGLPYFANVVHIPQSALATEQELLSMLPDDDHYYRVMLCGNRKKRVVVVDPTLHSIDKEDPEDNAEHPQDEFLKVGKMLMKNDPQTLDAHTTQSIFEGPSFVTSIFSLLSLNPSSVRLGGMV